MRADLEAKGSAAVKDLFEGNYEERRKFGVVDIFDTLGFAVSNCSWHDYKKKLLHAALLPCTYSEGWSYSTHPLITIQFSLSNTKQDIHICNSTH